jgi:hypothetical protein
MLTLTLSDGRTSPYPAPPSLPKPPWEPPPPPPKPSIFSLIAPIFQQPVKTPQPPVYPNPGPLPPFFPNAPINTTPPPPIKYPMPTVPAPSPGNPNPTTPGTTEPSPTPGAGPVIVTTEQGPTSSWDVFSPELFSWWKPIAIAGGLAIAGGILLTIFGRHR